MAKSLIWKDFKLARVLNFINFIKTTYLLFKKQTLEQFLILLTHFKMLNFITNFKINN